MGRNGFEILLEAKKKKYSSHPVVLNNKNTHAKVGFAGYAFSSNPGERNQTDKFQPTTGEGPAMPAATTIHQQSPDDGGVIEMTPGNGPTGVGPAAPAPTGDGGNGGDGGGAPAAAGEAIEANGVESILECFSQANPASADVIGEIRKMFNGLNGKNGALYHSCDGAKAISPDDTLTPTDDSQISALAASCEASLNAFKNYTGVDYITWRDAT